MSPVPKQWGPNGVQRVAGNGKSEEDRYLWCPCIGDTVGDRQRRWGAVEGVEGRSSSASEHRLYNSMVEVLGSRGSSRGECVLSGNSGLVL